MHSSTGTGTGTGTGGSSAASTIVRSQQIKLVLLGDAAVGKSSLVLRFVRGEFHEHKEPTIGGNFSFAFPCLVGSIIRMDRGTRLVPLT